MKYQIGIILLLVLSCQPKQNNSELKTDTAENNDTKLEVLLIGTFHFANFDPKNNQDIAETNEVDVLSVKNQKELELISDKIAEFKPDKIFVEYSFEYQNKLDSIFQSLHSKDFLDLGRNEIYQLAYRVAKKINHKKLFAFDYRNTFFPYGAMLETMEKANQTELLKKNELDNIEFESQYNELVNSTKSVTEVLYFLNDDKERKKDLGWYLNLPNRAGSLNDTIGTYLTSEWYRRNIHMYSTIQKQVTDADTKIMILAGSSHVAVFQDLINYNPDWDIVELKEIMK